MTTTAVRTGRGATYQDVLDAPPTMIAEIIDGALVLHPRPRLRHARAASVLTVKLAGPFDVDGPPGGWVILFEPELHLAANVLVPDLAGWRRDRMPDVPDRAFETRAPDWVCEVSSPGTRHLDLTAKRDLYAREGVGHLWLIDPDARTLEAFALEEGPQERRRWVLIAALQGDAEVRVPPFDAVAFGLSALWG